MFHFTTPARRLSQAILLWASLLLWAGCSPGQSTQPAAQTSAPPLAAIGAENSASTDSPAQSTSLAPQPQSQESWYAMFVEGSKVGYGRTAVTPLVEQGRQLAKIEEQVSFSVSRNGQRTDEKIVSTALETPKGDLLRFQTEINAGPEPMVTRGEVRDGQMQFESLTTGKTIPSAIPWPAGVGGFKAAEESLTRQPLQPGETRKLAGLMIGFNEIAQIELTAAAYEPTALLDHTEDLLRIQWTGTLPRGNVLRAVWWTDRQGEVLKMELDALHQVTYRTTREVALAESGPANFDLLISTTVPVNRPLEHPDRTRRIRYRVQLESADPSRIFVTGLSQRVTPLDPHTAEIEVRAVRPGEPKPEASAGPNGVPLLARPAVPPADEDRQPNNLVQSDDPQITALARQAAGGETDPWKTAVLLEKFVSGYISGKNYSRAFSTAVEVAQSREGACTQHAVLLAALARARGIPARVAIGLVYTEGRPGFAFHMWDEVWIADRWIALDATRGAGGIGAAYLKLADSSLRGEAAYSCFLPVTEVIGQTKIEILEVE